MWRFYERCPRPASLLFRLGSVPIVPGPLRAGDEVHGSDGDALDRGTGGGDGSPDGHGEVVVELAGCALSCGWLSPSASGNTA